MVYLNASVAERLLSCHVLPPLDSCTYLGLDSGATPICVSFVLIFLLSEMLCECRFVSEAVVSDLIVCLAF